MTMKGSYAVRWPCQGTFGLQGPAPPPPAQKDGNRQTRREDFCYGACIDFDRFSTRLLNFGHPEVSVQQGLEGKGDLRWILKACCMLSFSQKKKASFGLRCFVAEARPLCFLFSASSSETPHSTRTHRLLFAFSAKPAAAERLTTYSKLNGKFQTDLVA